MECALGYLEQVVAPALAEAYEKTLSLMDHHTDLAKAGDAVGPAMVSPFVSIPYMAPLKRRCLSLTHAERRRRSETAPEPRLRPCILPLEKLRDISPALVIAVYEDSLVLEPGDVGPIPLGHPIAQELIRTVNEQTISLSMLQKLRDSAAPFYDGYVVFGVVDYRRCAFHALSPQPSGSQLRPHMFASGAGLHRRPPEIHKILLRIPYETISADIHNFFDPEVAVEVEQTVLVSFYAHRQRPSRFCLAFVLVSMTLDKCESPLNFTLVKPRIPYPKANTNGGSNKT